MFSPDGTSEYQWFDFEEDKYVSTDEIPGKWVLTIAYPDGEELAVIIHRDCDGKYPIDGPKADAKRAQAQMIVDALNAFKGANNA